MRIAIMQPYFLPYIGYFQLINSVDKFIFYDDVNFIKNGWIKRNRVLINNTASYLTVQLIGASQNKLIKEVLLLDNRKKLIKTIQMAYKKAPFYNETLPVLEKCFEYQTNYISELAIFSIKEISQYLGLKTTFEISSRDYSDTKELDRADRLKKICMRNNADIYINPIGGIDLYEKKDFKNDGIELYFLKTHFDEYKQFSDVFIPGLSIIDVMMFNSIGEIRKMLDSYELL